MVRRMHSLARKVVLIEVIAVLATLAAGEAWMRVDLCLRAGEVRFERVRERFLVNPMSIGVKRRVPVTPLSAAGAAAGAMNVNAYGYRGPAVTPHKPRGLLRVVCLGGSSVYGTANSSWRAAWPSRMQQLLARLRCAEVVNGGVPGYQAHQSAERFEQLFVPLAPDAAILCNTYNDIVASRAQRMGYLAGDVAVESVNGVLPDLLSRSALGLRLLSSHIEGGDIWTDGAPRAGLRPISADVLDRERRQVDISLARTVDARRRGSWLDRCFYPQDLAEYVHSAERFVTAARRIGCTPVLCLEPLAVAPGDGEDAWQARAGPLRQFFPSGAVFADIYARYADALRGVAERHGALFLDAHGELVRPPGAFADVVHLSDAGATAFAEYLSRELGEQVWRVSRLP